MTFKQVLTEKINLQLLEPKHAEEWFEIIDKNRQYLRHWLNWLDDFTTVDHSRLFIQAAKNQFASNAGFKAAIFYDGRIIGGISIQELDWANSAMIIGGWVSQDYEGQGLVSRSLSSLIDYAFYELKINRVEVRCATENKKSRAIPDRLGFTQEGVFRDSLWLYDRYVDEAVYSLIAFEWMALKSKPSA